MTTELQEATERYREAQAEEIFARQAAAVTGRRFEAKDRIGDQVMNDETQNPAEVTIQSLWAEVARLRVELEALPSSKRPAPPMDPSLIPDDIRREIAGITHALRDNIECIARELRTAKVALLSAEHTMELHNPHEGIIKLGEPAIEDAKVELDLAAWQVEMLAVAIGLAVNPEATTPVVDRFQFDPPLAGATKLDA